MEIDNNIDIDKRLEKLDFLEELVIRWKKHINMIKKLQDTNLDKETLVLWNNQMNITFRNCIISRL